MVLARAARMKAADGGRLRSSAAGATGDARVASVDLTCRDAQLPASGRARLADDDVDIAAERGQQAEQALQGILAEVAPEQPRHVGWVRLTTRAGLLTTAAAHASTMPLTSSRAVGRLRSPRASNQSEYTLFPPSDCPRNQDHVRWARPDPNNLHALIQGA